MVIVTDLKWQNKVGETMIGFQMDGFLAENLQHIPKFLSQDRDIVGITSGRGKTRTGKSVCASQQAYYAAWLIAGGRMDLRRDPETGRFINPVVIQKPNKPINFSLKNVVYSVEELMDLAPKAPKNSVFMLDEAKFGNDSKSVMSSLNRATEQFFDECGQLNHVIILVLPDFFSLSANIATSRSHYLVDVYTDENYKRGFFNFFNETQKDFLFWRGKKLIGGIARANAARSNFHGKFPDFMPFDREEYEAKKLEAIKKRRINSQEAKTRIKFGAAIHLYKETSTFTTEEVASKLSVALSQKVTPYMIQDALKNYQKHLDVLEKRGTYA